MILMSPRYDPPLDGSSAMVYTHYCFFGVDGKFGCLTDSLDGNEYASTSLTEGAPACWTNMSTTQVTYISSI